MVNSALREIVAVWLEEGMAQAGLNPTTLSRQSGVSRDTIYRILSKETAASEETLQRLSGGIGRPLPDLKIAVEAPSRPVGARTTPEGGQVPVERLRALESRLAFLRDQLKAYRDLGQPPSPEILAEWLRVTADLDEMEGEERR